MYHNIPMPHNPNKYTERDNDFLNLWTNAVTIQKLQWTQIPDNTEIEVEIISPLKADQVAFAKSRVRQTNYIIFLTIVERDCEDPKLSKGDYMLLEIPSRTFERAMQLVPLSMKKQLHPQTLKDDNLYIKFKRLKYQTMIITEMERRVIKEEHKEYAKEYYSR